MKSAIAYLRVSSIGQIDGTGLARQEDAIRSFAKATGLNLVEVYSDEGVSGTVEGFDRPGLNRLLQEVEEGSTVVVENADRVARDLLVGEVIYGKFRDLKVRVLDTAGVELTNIDGDSTRTLIRQVLGAVAQFNKAQTVARLASARAKIKQEKGKCEGAKPQITPDTVAYVRELRATLTVRATAERLNAEGVPTPTGKGKWHTTTVQRAAA